MGRQGQSIALSISERDKAELENLARELGMIWGGPNISRLIEELLIGHNNDWSATRLDALSQARQALTDAGQTDLAKIVADLLLERSELSIPLRNEIQGFLAFSYQAKPEDEVNESFADTQMRKVIRKVTSTFWFFREIAPDWKDCEIVASDVVRDRVKQKLSAWCDLYRI